MGSMGSLDYILLLVIQIDEGLIKIVKITFMKYSCSLSNEDEFLLHHHYHTDVRKLFSNEISWLDESIVHLFDTILVEVLLDGKPG